jgi:predicted ATPase
VSETGVINTPDQRLRVFVSSTLGELAPERRAVRDAVNQLRLVPVMFETGARPHPARDLYRAYLAQSQVFVGVYWQRYGWVAPGEQISGLEDEYRLAGGLPQLLYVKGPAPDREPRLDEMLARIKNAGGTSYQHFTDAAELQRLVENDLAVLLSERFMGPRAPGNEPVAEVAPPAGALPVPPTPLVDREQEVPAVEALIRDEGVRLVTLTGPGGSGKSRLAVETVARLAPDFADGVRFIELASVSSADLVPGAVAAGLGLNTSSSRVQDDLVAYLRSRRLLLALDNFEQVTEAASLLAQLLATVPGLKLLVTSRTALRLSSEHEFPVLPLPVPTAGAELDAGTAGQYASIRLFTERAQAVAPRFELTSHNVGAVAEICRRLDGLPLAIELAAARVRMLPPQALLARLGDSLSVLTGGPRDLPERQRTLRNTLDWSFALLAPEEQALLARLGVFAAPFDLAAAEAVGGDAVIDTLYSLADSSLVQPETGGDEPQFRLLGTIRDYALEHLRDDGAWAGTHDRHAAYYVALVEPAEGELRGDGQLAWLNRLETEAANLSAALSWLIDQGQLDRAIGSMWTTWRFWWLRGHVAEIAHLWEKVAARQPDMTPRQRALALAGIAFSYFADRDLGRAQAGFAQSVPLFREAGDPLRGAQAAAHLGHVLAEQHDEQQASDVLERARGLLQDADRSQTTEPDRMLYLLGTALVGNFDGQIQLGQADHDRASQLFTAALDAARRASDQFTILISLYDLALSGQARGDLDGAGRLLREGLSLAAEAGDQTTAAYYLEALAVIARQQGDPKRAARLLAAAATQLQASGSGWLSAYVPRAPHDQAAEAELRSALGAAYDQATAEGGALTATQAVQLGLDAGLP